MRSRHVSTAGVAVASVLGLAAAVPAADAASGGQRRTEFTPPLGLQGIDTGPGKYAYIGSLTDAVLPSWRGASPAARTLRMNRCVGGRLLAATGDGDRRLSTPSAAAALAITSTAPVEVAL